MKKFSLFFVFALTIFVANAQISAPVFAINNTSVLSAEISTNDGDNAPQFTYYPNPVKDYLNIRFKEKGNYTIRIYNIVGAKIKEEKIHDNDLLRINLSEIQKGMYFISYEPGDGKVITKTFTKEQ